MNKAEFLAKHAKPDFGKNSAKVAVEIAIQKFQSLGFNLSKYREAAETILKAGL